MGFDLRVLITVEYYGKNYVGWQMQNNGVSVQEVLEEKLGKLLNEPIRLFASGRTDSGVNAFGQKAHFDTSSGFPLDRLHLAVNTLLPDDIRVKDAAEVDGSFHAQYSAKKKTYMYKMYTSYVLSPVLSVTHAQVIPEINFDIMLEGAKLLEGTHDFKAFCSVGGGIKKSTVRTVYAVTLERTGNEIILNVTGNGFLYNMVRIIAGTLVYLGKGKLTLTDVKEALETGNRKKAGKVFPAHALYLVSVEY